MKAFAKALIPAALVLASATAGAAPTVASIQYPVTDDVPAHSTLSRADVLAEAHQAQKADTESPFVRLNGEVTFAANPNYKPVAPRSRDEVRREARSAQPNALYYVN